MIALLLHPLIVAFSLLILNFLLLPGLISKNNYISNQIKYFIYKSTLLIIVTYFFCFFSPSNSTKFILLSLMIFIVFHFIEAIVIQKKINLKDFNE